MFEFGDSEEAIAVLKRIYVLIGDRSFPQRAAWERLRVFGQNPFHKVFSELPRLRPHPWPTVDGPFFGIRDLKNLSTTREKHSSE